MFNRDLRKGSAELLVLTLLEARARHGYDLGRLIEERSAGQIRFRIGSLYPILFRLEDRGLIAGRWMEKPGERRRRCYRCLLYTSLPWKNTPWFSAPTNNLQDRVWRPGGVPEGIWRFCRKVGRC